MKTVKRFILLFFVISLCVFNEAAFGGPVVYPRSGSFRVPRKLEDRVDFWINVFTKYGKYHSIVHHRDYPHVVFQVLDFYKEAGSLSKYNLERLIKKKEKASVSQVKTILRGLASGKTPRSAFEQKIAREMQLVPGGTKKYRKAVDEKLVRVQSGIREKYADSIRRSGRYMHIIEKIFVSEYNLPIELTRLPFIESSFDYKAYSSVGAAGIWQFMRRTARLYMRVNNAVDERRDVIASTRGAAKYLSFAYKQLDSWPLALTSYNHGVAGVKRKIKKMGTNDLALLVEHPSKRVFGFASNNFYPEFLAALEVYDNYPRYFPGVKPEAPLQVTEYTLPHSFSVQHIQKKLGIGTEELKKYNYGFSKYAWRGSYRIPKGYGLKVPPEFTKKLSALKIPQTVGTSASSVYGGLTYTVRRGDNLTKIARKYGATVYSIKKLNGLKSDRVYVGQKLKIKERENVPVSTGGGKLPATYRVRRGDSVYKIGRRYGATVGQVMGAYNLKSSRIKIGQLLKRSSSSKPAAKSKSSGRVYTVRRGDSLWSISRKFGLSIAHLKKLNRLSGSKVKIGQRLKL